MLLKKLSIQLYKLPFEHYVGHMAPVLKSNDAGLYHIETNNAVRRKRHLSSEKKVKKTRKILDTDYKKKVKKTRVVRKTRKIFDTKSEKENSTSEDSSSEEEDNYDKDPDYGKRGIGKMKKRNKNNEIVQDPEFKPKPKENLSAYEQMIEKNRAEKKALLHSLKIKEAKAALSEIVESAKKKKPLPVKRTYNKAKEEISPSVLRKSRRLVNFNVDLSEQALKSNAIQYEKCKKILPPEMSFKEALESEDFYESYVVDVNIQESKSEAKCFSYDKSVLKKMTVKESSIARVTPSRITALAWYPSPEQLVVAAGSSDGELGVWNVGSESNPHVFKIHLKGITNLQFSPFNQMQLVSSSYDGILRCGDMVQHSFNEVYNVSGETCCTYFDFLSATTYLVAQQNGQVALVDKRSQGKSYEKKHTCHGFSVRTVNIHPVDKNFFVTAENRGCIRLWDLRKLQAKPVADITHHKQSVRSAYFSPITGNSILATSVDKTISIFDSTNLTSGIKMVKQMKYNKNQTVRALWLPNSEEAFVIGNMHLPPKIEVFDKNMFAYYIIMNENLTTIISTNAFHPMRPALAAGNSSGKVFVFT